MLWDIMGYLWSIVRHPIKYYRSNKTAIWFWLFAIIFIIFVLIPWFTGVTVIYDWVDNFKIN